MDEDTITNLKDLSKKDLKALQKKPEEPVTGPSTLTSEWLWLPRSQNSQESSLSDIPPRQKIPVAPATLVTPVFWATKKKKSSEQYEMNRVGKYAPTSKVRRYFPFWN